MMMTLRNRLPAILCLTLAALAREGSKHNRGCEGFTVEPNEWWHFVAPHL